MGYTFRDAIKTAYKYLKIDDKQVEIINDTNGRGIVYDFDGVKTVIFIYPISCKQNNKQNFFDTRDSGVKERKVAWKYAQKHQLRYFCLGFNEEQNRYRDYVLSLESDESSISDISFRKSDSSESTGTQVNIPNDFIPSYNFERIRTPKGFYISAIKKDEIFEYIKLFDNRPYMQVNIEESEEDHNKRLFLYWMKKMQVKFKSDSDEENSYSDISINEYVNNIANTPSPSVEGKSLFNTTDEGEVSFTINLLDNAEKKNNKQISAVRKYLQYVQMLDNEDIFNHELFGMHIKGKNDALSEENPHVCIGWSNLGNLSDIESKEQLSELYESNYDKNNRGRGQNVGQIWRFIHDMKIGDYVILAENSVFHIGRIESDYCYDTTERESQDSDYKSNRKVKWLKKNISRSVLSTNLHNSLKTAMSIWTLNDYKSAVLDLLRGTYAKDGDIDMASEYIEPVYNTDLSVKYERNRIVFGAPGTGKSFRLKSDCEDLKEKTSGTYERVTFHPDYLYSQFVGTYKPVMGEDGKSIRYDFVPGPFMRVYVEAIKSGRTGSPKAHLLLIEEINRAKVAAVFGDVFQLLDRDSDGVSEYEIQASEDIRRYLAKELGGLPDNYNKIKLPNNMFIWATMNSADQGVFPMDTAFKRRWNFEYLGINESEKDIIGVGKIVLPGETDAVEWNAVRRAINDRMASEYRINEDKLMGPFFLAKKVIASDENGMIIDTEKFMDAFKSKVIMYLYEDAVKQRKHDFFNGCDSSKYSSVCEAFEEKGMAIFGTSVKNAVYNK